MARIKQIQELLGKLNKNGKLTKKQILQLCRHVPDALGELGSDSYRACSKNQILNILGIDKRTLNSWISRGARSVSGSGDRALFDPGKLLKWRIGYQKDLDKDSQVTAFEVDMHNAKLASMEERRRGLELNRKQKARLLLPADEVQDVFRTVSQILKSAIETEDDIDTALEYAQLEFNKLMFSNQDDLFTEDPIEIKRPAKKRRRKK